MDIPHEYKITEFGLIPLDWELCTFKDVLTTFSSGATPYRGIAEYYKGNVRWISSGELNYNKILDTIEHISEQAVRNSNLRVHQPGTFLMAITGLEAEGTRGRCAFVGAPATTNQSCLAINGTERMCTEYLFWFYRMWGQYLAFKYSQGTKQQSYTANIVKNLPIYGPKDIVEQQAIAEALSDIDGLIAALDKKIAKKRLIKQGAMQQLLTGKKRLPGFTDPWVEKKLGEIGVLAMCKRVFQEETSEKGDIPFYKIGTFGHQADAYISVEKYEQLKQMYRFPKKGDILISAAGTIGRTVVYDGKPAYFQDSNIIWLDHNEKQIVNSFLYFLYQVVEWNTENTTIARLYNDNFNNMTIRFPISIEEQNAIATVLSGMDKEIESLEAWRDKYRLLKSGMMQKLLTGQIRLIRQRAKVVPLIPGLSAAREIPVDAHILAGHIVNKLWQSKG